MSRLAIIAETQPHAAYSAFLHDFLSKWTYVFRTTPNISTLFSPLESIIRHQFIYFLSVYVNRQGSPKRHKPVQGASPQTQHTIFKQNTVQTKNTMLTIKLRTI